MSSFSSRNYFFPSLYPHSFQRIGNEISKKKNLHVLGKDNNEAKLIDGMEESILLTHSLSFSTSFIFFFFFLARR